MFELIDRLRSEQGTTVILISHSMDDAAEHADRLLVMDRGALVMDGQPKEIFSYQKELMQMGLDIPQVSKVMYLLKQNGINVNTDAITIKEALGEILRLF